MPISAPLFSTKITFGRRTFYFDVHNTHDRQPFVRIMQSTQAGGDKGRGKIEILPDEVQDFKLALADVFAFIETIV